MSFEIEQKYRTDGHADVAARLSEWGATEGPGIDQEDAYLSHPARDFARTNEALRLRKFGDRNAITYKGPKREGPTKTREELEVAFEGGPAALARMRTIFETLGFRPVAVIRKWRTPYRLSHGGRELEVVLDVAEGLGTFVEVETIAENEADLPSAQQTVLEVAEALGLNKVEPRSYLRMALDRQTPSTGG